MKDQQLFQHIKNVIKQKQNNAKDTEQSNFAETYCKKQLVRKKLNPYNPNQKMTHLMKNFRDLDTFVDLPELISSIKKWKFINNNIPPPSRDKNQSFLFKSLKNNSKLNNEQPPSLIPLKNLKTHLGQKIKQKYLLENSLADNLLRTLEQSTTIRSDGLKNHSYSNLNNLFQKISQDGQDQIWKGNFDFLALLNHINDGGVHGNGGIMNELGQWQQDKDQEIILDMARDKIKQKQNNISQQSKIKKDYMNLLHKITTYLQIILQTEHKQKWDTRKSNINEKGVFKQQHDFVNKPKKLPVISQKASFTIKMKKHGIRASQKIDDSSSRPILTSRVQRQSTFRKNFSKTYPHQTDKNSFHEDKEEINDRNNSFYRTTSSFKFRTQATMDQFNTQRNKSRINSLIRQSSQLKSALSRKQNLKQSFTFRNRNIKQKIIHRLSNFIRQIDEEQHMNRKDTYYYNRAINKLQNTLSQGFGQFKQEAVASNDDIDNLTKYARDYNNTTQCMGNVINVSQMVFEQTFEHRMSKFDDEKIDESNGWEDIRMMM